MCLKSRGDLGLVISLSVCVQVSGGTVKELVAGLEAVENHMALTVLQGALKNTKDVAVSPSTTELQGKSWFKLNTK